MPRIPAGDHYDSGLLVGPADEVTANALRMAVHDDEVGDLLIALLGWDTAILALCESPHPRAGRVLVSTASWLLIG